MCAPRAYPVVVLGVVDEPGRCCPLAPHALNAAWRAELPAPPAAPAPPAPPGGGPVRVPPLPKPGGGVRPWAFRHCVNAVRLPLAAPLEDAEPEAVLELLDELLPQAASTRLAVIAASAGITRSARRRVLLEEFMGSFRGY